MTNKNYEINIFKNIIHIKNYLLILDYNKNNIVIKLLNMKLNIYGSNLLINKLDEYELTILGIVNKMEYIY